MKTNRLFNFRRFYHLLSSDFRLNGKRYLFILAGGAIFVYLIALFEMNRIMRFEFTAEDYLPLFYVCAYGLCILAGSVFPEFNNKIKTGNYLLLPASALEKILSQVLIYIVFAILSVLLIFWIDTCLARWSMLQIVGQRSGFVIEKLHYSMLFQTMNNTIIYIVISIGLFLFTARLFFKRFALIKSIILLIVIILLIRCGLTLLSHIFYPENTRGFDIGLPLYKLTSGLSNIELYWRIIFYLTWIFSLPIAYYKLKEKQV